MGWKGTFWWLCRVLVGEHDFEVPVSICPGRLVFAGDAAFPGFQVQEAVGIFLRAGLEAKGVVFAPLLAARRVILWPGLIVLVLTAPRRGGLSRETWCVPPVKICGGRCDVDKVVYSLHIRFILSAREKASSYLNTAYIQFS